MYIHLTKINEVTHVLFNMFLKHLYFLLSFLSSSSPCITYTCRFVTMSLSLDCCWFLQMKLTQPEGVRVQLFSVQIFIIISTGQKNFFIFVLLSSCIKIAGEAHKMQKCTRHIYTHLFAFSIPNKSFSTTDCFRHINVRTARSALQYWDSYNANWMRKQWLKIKLPYLCATATAAHFIYC